MKNLLQNGISFGVTSGIITTLGLMVGLESSTNSRLAVIGGVLVIAIADALSDAFGMHMSKESEKKSNRLIWESTFSTFFSKLIIALTFIVPVLMFRLNIAIVVSVIWGLFLLCILSLRIARSKRVNPGPVMTEHIAIAIFVVIVSYLVGIFVSVYFA
jgi:VIT1/CCC1 family predicted Fe2+/Mn2+ transporter